MYKSKFKIGQTGFLLGMFAFVIGFFLWTLVDYDSLEERDKLFMRFGLPCLGFLFLFLGYKVFFEIQTITIDDKSIKIQNLITRKSKEIRKGDLKGYTDKFTKGYSIFLIDNADKVVVQISDMYIHEFIKLRDNLELPYLGRIPTLFDKFFKIEASEDQK